MNRDLDPTQSLPLTLAHYPEPRAKHLQPLLSSPTST
ncbi:hypothetical protein BJF96_g2249 [Verticillium dahliae]|uniref:Uncharacterized protein n=1 Tax=Verticillium dahliae TaxID=27337 RepID=A0AA45APU0_VERDA|nr:hypothetical protein BJF96_g2249 [Verticillium dahliae]